MKNYRIYIFFFFIQFSFMKILIIPFKRKINQNINENNLMENLFKNEIYSKISIGSPSQKLNIFIKLFQFPSFLISKDYKEGKQEKFNQNKSITFEYLDHYTNTFFFYDYKNGNMCKDIFYLGKDNKKIDKLNFILAKNLIEDSKNYSGELGLNLYWNIYTTMTIKDNIINQLKEKGIIEENIFYLKYSDKKDDEGELIIGNYLHNTNEKYLKENFNFTKVKLDTYSFSWSIDINSIYLGKNILINKTFEGNFKYEFGFIQGINEYYIEIKKNFFDNYKKECFEKEFIKLNNKNKNLTFTYFVCSNKVNIQKFPDLLLENNEMKYNFSLTYKDLFYNINNNNYFLVIFETSSEKSFYSNNWIFGKPLFKKYLIMFDRDKRIIGIYNPSKTKINIPYNIIIIVTLLLIILYKFKYDKVHIKRKLRANELDDDYIYIINE